MSDSVLARGRDPDAGARVPPDGRRAGRRGRLPPGGARGPSGGSRGSCSRVCTRVICTRTGRPSPVSPVGSWRGAGRHEQQRLIGVGVGPGDPELVTVKGVNALRAADVVVVPVMDTGWSGGAPRRPCCTTCPRRRSSGSSSRSTSGPTGPGARPPGTPPVSGSPSCCARTRRRLRDHRRPERVLDVHLSRADHRRAGAGRRSSRPCPASPPCRISRRGRGPYSPRGPSR